MGARPVAVLAALLLAGCSGSDGEPPHSGGSSIATSMPPPSTSSASPTTAITPPTSTEPPTSTSPPPTTAAEQPADVEGVASIRFTDDSKSAVEVCVTYVDPATAEPDIICAQAKADVWTAQRNLPFVLRHDADEYFRDDAAISLAQINPESLPLARGDRGEQVEFAQQGLEAFCFHLDDAVAAMRPGEEFPSSTPGEFDDITEFMVRRAQASHGLTVDGVYGPATHNALLAEAMNNTPRNEGCFA